MKWLQNESSTSAPSESAMWDKNHQQFTINSTSGSLVNKTGKELLYYINKV